MAYHAALQGYMYGFYLLIMTTLHLASPLKTSTISFTKQVDATLKRESYMDYNTSGGLSRLRCGARYSFTSNYNL